MRKMNGTLNNGGGGKKQIKMSGNWGLMTTTIVSDQASLTTDGVAVGHQNQNMLSERIEQL